MGLKRKLQRAAKAVGTFGYSEVKPARDLYRKNSAGINTAVVTGLSFVAPPVAAAVGAGIKFEAARKAQSQAKANPSPVFDSIGYYTQAESYPVELPGVNAVSQLYTSSNRQPPYLRAQAEKRLGADGRTREDNNNLIAAIIAGAALIGAVWLVTK